MFITHSQAELPFPDFTGNGNKMWTWVEFGTQVPYLLVEIKYSEECGEDFDTVTQHVLLSDVAQLVDMRSQEDNSQKIKCVSVLIPKYMRENEDNYSMGRLKEIWECKETGSRMFVLENNEMLTYRRTESEPNYEVVFKV